MPAIDLARLKTQAALLSDQFGDPQAFLAALQEMLDFYTNRTRRASQDARRLSLPTYHTPTPVLRQIERELQPLAETRPAEAVALVNALWKAASLEARLLAARLLGNIPPAQAIPALTHLPEWLAVTTDKPVRQALLTDAFLRIRRENPQAVFLLLEDWLASRRSGLQVWGLQALVPILKDPEFENLPAVLRIVRPAFLVAGPNSQIELQGCLAALERVSLTETLAFVRELLTGDPPPMLLRTLRRILPGFSPELQSFLRERLREKGA
jgi:hypothetical protein